MEEKTLNLEAPLLSIRRIQTKPELFLLSSQSFKTTKTQSPVFVSQDQSFDHLNESASIPFIWEQSPGKPKPNLTPLIQPSHDHDNDGNDDDDDDDDDVSSIESFSVNCSTSGVSEIEVDFEIKNSKSKEGFDLMMSRFIPAAKAMTLKLHKHHQSSEQKLSKQFTVQTREVSVSHQLAAEHEHSTIINTLYQDLDMESDDNDDDDDGNDDGYGDGDGDGECCFDERIYKNVNKKACGFLPLLCAKNSSKFLNPVISRSNQSLNQSNELPNWSTRRLSGFISPYRLSESGLLDKAENFKRLNREISKSQELYPLKRRDILSSYSNSGEIGIRRYSISSRSSPLGIQRSSSKDLESRFLAEEVMIKRSRNKSGNLVKSSPEYSITIYPPPLPETPSKPWLRRRVLPPVNPSSSHGGVKKRNQEQIEESTKWETIVKTSYVHNDHARYSQELMVHPSRQHKT